MQHDQKLIKRKNLLEAEIHILISAFIKETGFKPLISIRYAEADHCKEAPSALPIEVTL